MTMNDLREAAFTTSRLWEHLHIEVGNIANPFHAIGDVECCICGVMTHDDREKLKALAQGKSAARKVLDWLVNGDSGLNAALHPAGIYRMESELLEDSIAEFTTGVGHRATVFMMNRKQFRAIKGSLIKPSEDQKYPIMFDRTVIINDYIDYNAQAIWGLNLGPGGLHLWETEDGLRKEPGTKRVLWDVGIGYQLSDDVTCMRKACND